MLDDQPAHSLSDVDRAACRCLRWGVTYRGAGEVSQAVAAVTAVLDDLGLEVRTAKGADGGVAIEAEDRRSLYRLLSARSPQAVRGWIEPVAAEVGAAREIRLCLDLHLQARYRAVVILVWALWTLGLGFLFQSTAPVAPWRGPGAALSLMGCFTGVVVLIACGGFLLRVLGGSRMDRILRTPVLQRLEASEVFLDPEGTGVSRRYACWTGGYGGPLLLWAILMTLDVIRKDAVVQAPGPVSILLLGLLGCVVLMLGAGAAIALRRGFAVRGGAVISGLWGPFFTLFVLALPLPLLVGAPATGELLAAGDDRIAWWARLQLGLCAGLGFVGFFVSRSLLRGSVDSSRHLEKTHRHQRFDGIYSQAVRGGGVLVLVRLIFIACVMGLAAILLTALGLALCWAVQAVAPVWDRPLLVIPDATGPLLGAALGRPLDDTLAELLAKVAWIVWASAAWALLGVSVGHLLLERRRLRRLLLDRVAGASRSHRRVVDRLDRFVRRGGGDAGSVRLSISPDPAVAAQAYRFAWPRGSRFIEVSSGALRRLAPEELDAVLAHELAHLLRGHVLRHDLARWLGRMSFVGDGFARGLLDSFNWELEADQEVVLTWRIPGEALIRALWKVAALGPRLPVGRTTPGTAFEEVRMENPRSAPSSSNGRLATAEAWRAFREQYFHGARLHYWHPLTDERVLRIREIDRCAGFSEATP